MNLDPAFERLLALMRHGLDKAPDLLIAALVLLAFWFTARWVGERVQQLVRRTGRPANLGFVLARLSRWAMVSAGVMMALIIVVPSLNAASFISAMGIGGVAVGFAFKDIFQNLLAGLLLLLTRPFVIGDQIISGAHEGTVEDIQVRATLLRTYDNRLVVIPNSELFTNRVVVNTAKAKRRVSLMLRLDAADDLDNAKRLMLEAVRDLPEIEREPEPRVLATGLGDKHLELMLSFWVGPPRRGDIAAATDVVVARVNQALKSRNPQQADAPANTPAPAPEVPAGERVEPQAHLALPASVIAGGPATPAKA